MKTAEWDRAARLGSRKLKKVGRASTLVTRKNSAGNPELEIVLGRGKTQSSHRPHQAHSSLGREVEEWGGGGV